MENKQINLKIGDLILVGLNYCPITDLSPNGVIILDTQSRVHRFINNDKLIQKNYEYLVEFEKDNTNNGVSHAKDVDSAEKEKELLESIGYKVHIRVREVR